MELGFWQLVGILAFLLFIVAVPAVGLYYFLKSKKEEEEENEGNS